MGRLYIKKFIILISSLIFLSCLSTRSPISQSRDRGSFDKYTCQNVVSASQLWLGVQYKYGGTTQDGVDCSGFVQNIYKQVFDIELPRTTTAMYDIGTFLRDGWLSCGDLVFFRNIRGRGVDHVGIYLGNNKFIHASTSKGVVVSDFTSSYYQKHFAGARRYTN